MSNVKYIKTEDNEIIVFSEYYTHDQFKHFKPISAGFISIGAEDRGEPTVKCYGKSISLGLESEEIDSELAKRQILGYGYY